jgi:type IV pilus assembly protein PilA
MKRFINKRKERGIIHMKKIKNNKGFTLVELIVVMAIMAILVGALAPQVVKYVDKARESKDLQVASTVFTAIQTELISSDTDVVSDIGPITITEFGTAASALYTSSMLLLSDDMNTPSLIEGKLKSKNGVAGDLIIEYDIATGKLQVGIGSYTGTTAAYTIGPVTN